VGVWQRVKVRLGLEDEWDGYESDEFYDDEPDDVEDGYDSPARAAYPPAHGSPSSGARRTHREADDERRAPRSLHSVPTGAAAVASVAPQVRIHIVEPKSFGEVQSIADKFKQGTPVVVNMTATKADLAKRLIDFASGLTYGLDGGLQKISEKVFLLTPANVDVSAEDRMRLKDTGLFGFEG
jgi:cell division inhibitor SepF